MAKTIVTVDQGGTGAETLTDGGVLLGSGTGAVTATAVLADGEILVGDGTTDPVALDVGSSTAITVLGTVATGTWNGTAIANANLANSAVTVGTTSISLGASSTTLAGLTSVTSTGFTGDLTGEADTVTTNANLTGDVTSSGNATTIAAGAVDIAMLSATGTASSSTYLRGDNAWAATSGSGDVSKVGTPVDNQISVWTGDGTIEGTSSLVFDSTGLGIGTTAPASLLEIQSANGAVTLDSGTGEIHTISIVHKGSYAEVNGIQFRQGSTSYGNNQIYFRAMDGAGTVQTVMTLNGTGRVTVKKSSNSEITALTDASTIAIDFDDANNFSLLTTSGIGASRALGTPSNITAGQSGCIVITSDAALRDLTYTSAWHFEGGTDPSLTQTSGGVDTLAYYCPTASVVQAVLLKDLK